MPIDALVAAVLDRWRTCGLGPCPPCSPERLREFEQRHGVELPPDVRAYFAAADGMDIADGMYLGYLDERDIRFWPLEEVGPADPASGTAATVDRYFAFADFLIDSHTYAIRLRGAPPHDVVLVGGPAPRPVAASFSEFLEAYLERPDSLF